MRDTSSTPRVSVIIPVLNDADRLTQCLDALARQTLSDPFEILVVDNGSRQPPQALIDAHPNARLLFETKPSSYAARNRAVIAAVGDVLAFTDSDCIPDPAWLERGVRTLAQHVEPSFLAGRVDVFAEDPRAPTPTERWEAVHAFPQREYAEQHSFAVTANMLVSRAVFAEIGDFSSTLISSGDREWGQRAGAAGVRAVYADDVRVAHPARRSLREVHRKVRRVQQGEVQLRTLRGQPILGRDFVEMALRPPVRSVADGIPRLSPSTPRTVTSYVTVAWAAHYMRVYERFRAARQLKASA